MDLLERIDEITANSVTPEEFKQTWGYTIDEHVADMMDRIHQLETGIVVTGLVGQAAAKKSGTILVEPAKGIEGGQTMKGSQGPK